MFVQLWIVPRVETRKRREDRWERDVLKLGEFSRFDLASAHDAITNNYTMLAMVHGHPQGIPEDHLDTTLDRLERGLASACEAYARVNGQAEWMVDSLVRLEPNHDRGTYALHSLIVARVAVDEIEYDLNPKPTMAEAANLTSVLKHARTRIDNYVDGARDRRAPRKPGKLRQRVESWRHRLTGTIRLWLRGR